MSDPGATTEPLDEEAYQEVLDMLITLPLLDVCDNCQTEHTRVEAVYHCSTCKTIQNYCGKCFIIHQRFAPFLCHAVNIIPKPVPIQTNETTLETVEHVKEVCQICLEYPHAYTCTTCEKSYCNFCIHIHNQLRKNKEHVVTFLGENRHYSAPKVESLSTSLLEAGPIIAELENKKLLLKNDRPHHLGLSVTRHEKFNQYKLFSSPFWFEVQWKQLHEIFFCDEFDISGALNQILSSFFSTSDSRNAVSLTVNNFYSSSDALLFQKLFFESIALLLTKKSHPTGFHENWFQEKQQNLDSLQTDLFLKYAPNLSLKVPVKATKLTGDLVFLGLQNLRQSEGIQFSLDPDTALHILNIAEGIQNVALRLVNTKDPPVYTLKLGKGMYEAIIATTLGNSIESESQETKRMKPQKSSAESARTFPVQNLYDALSYQDAFFLAIELCYSYDRSRHNLVTWQNLKLVHKHLVLENESAQHHRSLIDSLFNTLMEEIENNRPTQMRLAINTLLLSSPLFCEFIFIDYRYEPREGKGAECTEEYFYIIASVTHNNQVIPKFQARGTPNVYDRDLIPSYKAYSKPQKLRFFFNYRRLLDRENAFGPKIFLVETVEDLLDPSMEIRFVYFLDDRGNDSSKWQYVAYLTTKKVLFFNEPQDREDQKFLGIGM